jgi:hypothetical protein
MEAHSLGVLVTQLPTILKAQASGSAVLFALGGLLNVFAGSYSHRMLNLHVLILGLLILVNELHPNADRLFGSIPALGQYHGRGAVYTWAGLLALGSDEGACGQFGGALLIFAGLAQVMFHYAGPSLVQQFPGSTYDEIPYMRHNGESEFGLTG